VLRQEQADSKAFYEKEINKKLISMKPDQDLVAALQIRVDATTIKQWIVLKPVSVNFGFVKPEKWVEKTMLSELKILEHSVVTAP
jgi:hypothetical protein